MFVCLVINLQSNRYDVTNVVICGNGDSVVTLIKCSVEIWEKCVGFMAALESILHIYILNMECELMCIGNNRKEVLMEAQAAFNSLVKSQHTFREDWFRSAYGEKIIPHHHHHPSFSELLTVS